MNSKDFKPRRPNVIKQEIRELELSSLSSKEWLNEHPDDKLIELLLKQDSARKSNLVKELESSYSYYRRHFFNYSIKTDNNVDIVNLSESLNSFSKVITDTLRLVSNSTKSMPLYFDTVVQSSFGIVLSTDWDSELIGTSYEQTFNKFFDIIENLTKHNDTEDDTEHLLSLFFNDKTLMQRYRTFYRGIAYHGCSVDLRWGGFFKIHKRSHLIDHNKASKIYKKLSDIDKPLIEDVKVTGSIQGISLIDKSLQFVPHQKEGTRIKLLFDESFKEQLKPLLGEIAEITYRIQTEYDEIKDKMTTKKFLTGLGKDH